MANPIDHAASLRDLDWDGLVGLWGRIERRQTPDWPAGRAFEYLVLRAFELDGARVRWPYTVRLSRSGSSGGFDEQIDGAVFSGHLACLVETKDEADEINVEPIAKLRNQLLRRPAATLGLVFSRSGFTESARLLSQYVAPQAILLWEGREVGFALQQRSIRSVLEVKYQILVEEGVPDYIRYLYEDERSRSPERGSRP